MLCIAETEGVEKGKVYRVVADSFAQAHKLIRIVDDSEEDYLFPAANFVGVTVPQSAEKYISAASRAIRPRSVSLSSRRKAFG